MTERAKVIETLRQAWRELSFECSPTADDLAPLVFELAAEWGVPLLVTHATRDLVTDGQRIDTPQDVAVGHSLTKSE